MTDATQAKLDAAFALVCPRTHALMLASKGIISAADAETVSWKDPIATLVLDEELAAAGVTIDDVSFAVAAMTATDATITREMIGMRAGDDVKHRGGGRPGYLVIAKGYRAGPAGDH